MPKGKASPGNFDDYEGHLEPIPGDTGDEAEDEFDFAFYVQYVIKNEVKHRVSTDEIRQVFANNPKRKFAQKGKVPGEDVYYAFGRSDDGRYLLVVFIWKLRAVILPVSARDMEDKERRYYGKK